ncbi:MAG TPA: hypothetical protein VGK61_02135 [Planctomycetota bacterium]|jgi:hypothetical protein
MAVASVSSVHSGFEALTRFPASIFQRTTETIFDQADHDPRAGERLALGR